MYTVTKLGSTTNILVTGPLSSTKRPAHLISRSCIWPHKALHIEGNTKSCPTYKERERERCMNKTDKLNLCESEGKNLDMCMHVCEREIKMFGWRDTNIA